MFLVQLALGVDHLGLYPQTELNAGILGRFCQSRDAAGQLGAGRLPIAQAGMVVLTGIFIAEPSVV